MLSFLFCNRIYTQYEVMEAIRKDEEAMCTRYAGHSNLNTAFVYSTA